MIQILSKKNVFLLAATLVVTLWLGGFVLFVHQINSYAINEEEITDALVVLTGGRNRIKEGIRLLNDNKAAKLFISGVPKHVTLEDIEANSGITADNPQQVELGFYATNTIQNATEITEWIAENNIHSIRLITSNYHIPRSLAELSGHKLPLKIIVHPVFSEQIAADCWQSWGSFKFVVAEYNKFLFVYIRNLIGIKGE